MKKLRIKKVISFVLASIIMVSSSSMVHADNDLIGGPSIFQELIKTGNALRLPPSCAKYSCTKEVDQLITLLKNIKSKCTHLSNELISIINYFDEEINKAYNKYKSQDPLNDDLREEYQSRYESLCKSRQETIIRKMNSERRNLNSIYTYDGNIDRLLSYKDESTGKTKYTNLAYTIPLCERKVVDCLSDCLYLVNNIVVEIKKYINNKEDYSAVDASSLLAFCVEFLEIVDPTIKQIVESLK